MPAARISETSGAKFLGLGKLALTKKICIFSKPLFQFDDLPVSSQAKAETHLVLTAFVLLHSIINTKFSAYIGTVGPNFETSKHVVAQ